MKEIKIKFCGFPKNSNFSNLVDRFFLGLKEKYVFIESDSPDYFFITSKAENLSYLNPKYSKAVRIFYCPENIHPNFHFYDYCISFLDDLHFGDRYLCHIPAEDINRFISNSKYEKVSFNEAMEICRSKDLFCDFSYNHDTYNKTRSHYYELLSKYKDVTNCGVFLNPNPSRPKSYRYQEKFLIQKRCKFSIIVESFDDSNGLITEKIFHALLNNTIPIYYGDNKISNIVNPDRFIDAKKYADKELLDLIIKIDKDDALFSNIISQKCLVEDDFLIDNQKTFNDFLDHIFSQEIMFAKKRPESYYQTRDYDMVFWNGNRLLNNKLIKKVISIRSKLKLLFRK